MWNCIEETKNVKALPKKKKVKKRKKKVEVEKKEKKPKSLEFKINYWQKK
jgi:hypothetical protein